MSPQNDDHVDETAATREERATRREEARIAAILAEEARVEQIRLETIRREQADLEAAQLEAAQLEATRLEAARLEEEDRLARDPTPPALAQPPLSRFEELLLTYIQNQQERPIPNPPNKDGPKARAPDKFDGSDRSKLRAFLSTCRLAFLNHPDRFADDLSKVLYAGSYLSGTAGDWFAPLTLDDADEEEAEILTSWKRFAEELQSLFGEPDEEAAAEREILDLKMKENQQVSLYITKFRSLQARLDWNDSALVAQFRRGLPDRILDLLSIREVRPRTLKEVMDVALSLDLRYHERQQEKKKHSPFESSNRTPSKESQKESPSKPSSSSGNDKTPHSKPAQKTTSALPLGEDGKLKLNEKERRAKLGLCAYCGDKHNIEQCAKRKIANIRAATLEVEDPPEQEASDASENP